MPIPTADVRDPADAREDALAVYVVRRPKRTLRAGPRVALLTVVVAVVSGVVLGLIAGRPEPAPAPPPAAAAPVAAAADTPAATPAATPTAVATPTPVRTATPKATGTATPSAKVTGAGALVPRMRAAFADAKAAARKDGVTLTITSGYRTPELQQRLYKQAIAKYGSPEVARRWVLPPGESAHVQGEAIDVRPEQAARWLEKNGARYGLCRRYANEWWHFEVLTERGGTCPALEPYAGG